MIDVDDTKFQLFVIDKLVPFPVVLAQAGYENYTYQGKVFCPFHENFETPAAKLYNDGDKGDTLFCFSEQRIYRPSDVFRRKLTEKSFVKVFFKLWNQLDDSKRQKLAEDYGKPFDILPEQWKEHSDKLELFKQGKISINQHIDLIIKLID